MEVNVLDSSGGVVQAHARSRSLSMASEVSHRHRNERKIDGKLLTRVVAVVVGHVLDCPDHKTIEFYRVSLRFN